jgi:hypothetical protein
MRCGAVRAIRIRCAGHGVRKSLPHRIALAGDLPAEILPKNYNLPIGVDVGRKSAPA